MKLHLQRQELKRIRDLLDLYLDNDECEIINNTGTAITDRLSRETLFINIKKLNCLGKVEFTITNEQDELEEKKVNE